MVPFSVVDPLFGGGSLLGGGPPRGGPSSVLGMAFSNNFIMKMNGKLMSVNCKEC